MGHTFRIGMRWVMTGIALAFAAYAPAASAQSMTQTFVIGGNGGAGTPNVEISKDQEIMLEAGNRFVQHDYAAAESMYTQAIALNSGNIEAYLQRGAVRREMGNRQGMITDAQTVISLANQALQQNPNDPTLYYRRGMGYRLLRQFDQAERDIATGMNIGGKANWKTDIKAIEIERKTAE